MLEAKQSGRNQSIQKIWYKKWQRVPGRLIGIQNQLTQGSWLKVFRS